MSAIKQAIRWAMAPLAPVIRWAMTSTPAYDAAGNHRRIRGWQPDTASINALLAGAGDDLRAKSRDSVRRNCWARNTVDSYVGNAIGSGIIPQSLHPNPREREVIQSAWTRWTDHADATGTTDAYGLQSLACRETIEAGEVFALLQIDRDAPAGIVPLQLRLLESEHCPFWKNDQAAPDTYVRSGIEMNGRGRRIAYHLYPEHPHDINQPFNNELQRVLAADVLHLFKPLRAGQLRGEPWLTPVLALIYDLEKYDNAELMRKQIAAMMAFFIEDADPGNPLLKKEYDDDDGVPVTGIEPGSAITLPTGKTVKISEPTDVGGMYAEFIKAQLRKFAAGVGVTYEQVSGDLSGVNYSSIRAGLLEFRRRCEAFQHQVMVYQFCRPAWVAWMDAAALSGVINAEAYMANRADYLAVEWRTQAWPWVDPLKDLEAEVMAIDNLLKSRTAAIKERGYDREQVDREIAADQESEQRNLLQRRATSRVPQPQEQPNNAAA